MKRNKAWMSVLLPAVLALGACGGEDEPSPQPGGPTVHEGFITSDETWLASGNPHVVKGMLFVGGSQSPVLTLEAGVQVRFESESGLSVGTSPRELGSLRVAGTQEAPVLLTANADAPQPGHWLGVTLGTGAGLSRFSHATIEYAGGIFSSDDEETREFWKQNAAGLHIVGGEEAPENFRPAALQAVTVQRSANHGVILTGGGFAEGSLGLNLRDNEGVALKSTANEVGTLPAGSAISGNTVNEIHVLEGTVTTSQTWHNAGAPYVLTSVIDLGLPNALRVGSAAAPVLTLSPGTELRLPEEGYISIGYQNEDGTLVPGRLQAVGTAQAPIRFGPTGATAGFWSGLFFYGAQDTSLEYVTVAQAGQPLFGLLGGGNLNVNGDLGVSVRHSTLSGSVGCGIAVTIGPNGSAPDYVAEELQNVFTGNAGGAQCNR
ncbi:hypothetical protein [Stigmatella hybrida]|uniref:hypothetical protein n=1 Tax=Stigmatella hybrida TaxID=394097 RepID=UPI001CDA7F5B|nr:hypothetical protein [Stigmatella hybrida]